MIALDVIRRHAVAAPDRTALVDGNTRITWARLASDVDRLARSLPARQRAAFLAPNCWRLVETMAACATAGVPLTGLDYTLSPGGLAAALRQLDPDVVFTTPEHQHQLTQAGWTGRAAILGEPAREPAGRELQPYRAYCFTSGTSGQPKLVMRTVPFEARRFADLVTRFGFTADDTHLLTVPLYHASAPGWGRLHLTLGGTVVLGPPGDPTELARLLAAERVTTTLMVPPVLGEVIRYTGRDLDLRFAVTGGRHLSRRLVSQAAERLGPVLHLYYGTTETGLNLLATPQDLERDPLATGRPLPGSRVLILGPDGELLPAGTTGRVALGGYQLMTGYPHEEAGFVEHERKRYLVTADTGWLAPDGSLTLTGREGVASFGLESDLLDLPGVRNAAVVRLSGTSYGVAIVPSGQWGRRDDARVWWLCSQRVPDLSVHVATVDTIPYSPTGKVRHRLLAAHIQATICPSRKAA